jgi:hypothetical protein
MRGGDRLSYMTVSQSLQDKEFWRKASLYQLIYSLAGLLLGLAAIIAGAVLGLHGVYGATSWTARVLGASSQVSDAAPGTVLFIVGFFVVWVTRYGVKIR